MSKKLLKTIVLILFAFAHFVLQANIPPYGNPDPPTNPCDGNCGGGTDEGSGTGDGSGEGDSGSDPAGDESGSPESPQEPDAPPDGPQNNCPRCGGQLNSIDIEIAFGRMVSTKLIPNAKFKIYSQRPTPTLFSPQKLIYDFKFQSYIESQDDGTNLNLSLRRPDGHGMKADLRKPTHVQASASTPFNGHSCGTLGAEAAEASEAAARSTGFSTALEQAPKLTRFSKNGSLTSFVPYSFREQADVTVTYYRVDSITTSNGVVLRPESPEIGIEVLRDTDQTVRQVKSAADGLADIVVTEAGVSYEIRMYAHDAIGAKENNIYTLAPDAVPYRIWRIEKADLNSYDKVRVTRITGTDVHMHEWVYSESDSSWRMTNGSGSELTVLKKAEEENLEMNRVRSFHSTLNAAGEVERSRTELHETYGSGKMLLEESVDPDQANLKTSYTYDRDSKLQKSVRYPNGQWKYSEYNTDNYLTREVFSYKNITFSTTGGWGMEVLYDYEPHCAEDVKGASDGRPRTKSTRYNGVAASKIFYAYRNTVAGREEIEEIAATPNSNFGSSGNARTVKVYDPNNARLRSVQHPNGTLETYGYEYGVFTPGSSSLGSFTADATGGALRKTVIYGTVANPGGLEGKSKRTVTIIDARGNVVQKETHVLVGGSFQLAAWEVFEYDALHRITRSLTSSNQLNEKNWTGENLANTKSDSGVEYFYTYDSLDRVATETRRGANGIPDRVTSYTYNASGEVLSTTVSGGGLSQVSSRAYDGAGRIIRDTDSDGLVTTYSYQKATSTTGDIVTTTYPGGFTKVTEYYFDGKVKSITGTAQVAQYFNYDVDVSGCRVETVTLGNPNSGNWTKTYKNSLGQVARIETSGFNGAVIAMAMTYNFRGQLIKQTRTGQAATLYAYDEMGNLIREGLDVDGDGVLTLASADRITETDTRYISGADALYREQTVKGYATTGDGTPTVLSVTRSRLNNFPAGMVSQTVQNDLYGNVTTRTVSVNRNTKTVTTETVYPDSTVAGLETTVNGHLASVRSRSNLTTSYTYDALGREIGITDPRTGTQILTYYGSGIGKAGKLATVSDAAGNTTSYDYDAVTGRKILQRNALGKTTRYEYNERGQVIRLWGEAEYPLSFAYDALGRQISQTTYRDTAANFGGVSFPGITGDVTSWTYDAGSGLVTAKTDAAGKSTQYAYTPEGKLASRTWARQQNGAALTTQYLYDLATGELLRTNYSDAATASIVRTYNRLGKLATVVDAAGTRSFSYNGNFDLVGETLTGLYSRTQTYTYSTTGFKGRYTGMAGNHSYGYDAYGRLNQVNDHGFTRLANSNLLSGVTRPNSLSTVLSYEAQRNLVSGVTHGALSSYGYTNNAVGSRTALARSGSVFAAADTIRYSYNDRLELTGASSDASGSSYHYNYGFDPIGNRLTANLAGTSYQYTSNLLNQYTAVNAATPVYDFDGNLTSHDGWSYTWNGENRLVKAEKAGVKLEFAYDYMGRRIFKKKYENDLLSESLLFVYDGYKLVEERNGLLDNQLIRRYVWQPESLGYDVPLSVFDAAANATYFYHTDANKNVTELSDVSGNVVAHYEYSPFGETVKSEGAYAESNPLRFSSEYHDDETGLVYYNYRYYHPTLGRWISRDPIEEQGGFNLYNMVGNSPVDLWDELGYAHWCPPKWVTDILDEVQSLADDIMSAHYGRNTFNDVPDNESTAKKEGFDKLTNSQSVFHGVDEGNSKYIHGDGREAVYDSKGNLVTNPNTLGTFNYSDPKKNPIDHGINDVLPYYLWGNSPNDTTSLKDKIINSLTPIFMGKDK